MKSKAKTKPRSIGPTDTMASLARALQTRYGDEIKIVVDADCVRDWRKGARLPRGTPPPPAKVGNYFPARKWQAWFEKWILPHHGHASPGAEQDLAAQATAAKYRTVLITEREAALNLEILSGSTMLKSEASQIVCDLGASLNAIQNSALELRARVALKERLGAANLEMPAPLLDFVCEYLKSINRELKETIRTKMYEENEN